MTSNSQNAPQPSFGPAEIIHLIKHDLPAFDTPSGSSLSDTHGWLAAVQGKNNTEIKHPRIALFLSSYTEDGQDMLKLLDDIRNPRHPLAALAAANNADLQVHELGRAVSEDDMLHAIAYGMMAAAPGIDLMTIALLNPAHEDVAQKLMSDMDAGTDPLATLLASRNIDIAAALGAALAARLARIPVVADGKGAEALISMIQKLAPGRENHIRQPMAILPVSLDLPIGAKGAFLIPVLKNIAALRT